MLKRDQRVVPLYYQVQHTIAQRISRGEYPPGAQLPPETELSRELGVSRVTVREALRVLAQENMLIKVQGRGTFVANNPSVVQPTRSFTGYLEDLYDQLERVSVKQIEITRIPVTDEVRQQLALSPADEEVVRIKRTRYVDEEPYAYTINILPLAIGNQLNNENLRAAPLVRILEEDLKIQITGAHETIQAAAADVEVAQSLGIPFLSPVMHVKRILFTVDDRPLQLVDSYYPSDKYHYSVSLVRVQDKGKWSWSRKEDSDRAAR
ncbi:MAG: GntR family transcriptional regulator [Acidobacteria bacterium]|nr:GntR family transcriptional regulator [Acidobacteriota bacterium]